MSTTRTGPVPDNAKDTRSPNPQEFQTQSYIVSFLPSLPPQVRSSQLYYREFRRCQGQPYVVSAAGAGDIPVITPTVYYTLRLCHTYD